VTGSAIAAPAMNDHSFSGHVGCVQKRQDMFRERLSGAEMMVFNRPHQNAFRSEMLLVFGLEVDRESGQLRLIEKATHSRHSAITHEPSPLQDAVQRRIWCSCTVDGPLAALSRTEMEMATHLRCSRFPNPIIGQSVPRGSSS
jgi:hypothetical protein